MADIITSASNPAVKRLAALATSKGRREAGTFIIEGMKLIGEAMAAGMRPRTLLATEKAAETPGFSGLCSFADAVLVMSDAAFAKAVSTVSPQGVAAEFDIPHSGAPLGSRIAVLDGVQDPGNCGTIWRTCEAAGFDGIAFLPGCAEPFSPKVFRAAMGAALRVPCCTPESGAGFVESLAESGFAVVVTALDGDDFLRRSRIEGRLAVVIGSEARGVSPEVSALASCRLRLPMAGQVESLNAAVAAGIVMYDIFMKNG